MLQEGEDGDEDNSEGEDDDMSEDGETQVQKLVALVAHIQGCCLVVLQAHSYGSHNIQRLHS